jgi:hypothetical protein
LLILAESGGNRNLTTSRMSTAPQQRNWLANLDSTMRTEQQAQRQAIEDLWSLPLFDRVREGQSLGPLLIANSAQRIVTLKPQTSAASASESILREADFVRLSRDEPARPAGNYYFLGRSSRRTVSPGA